MKQAALSQFDITWIPITGLVLFVCCFGLYVYWTYRKDNKPHYQAASLVPLEDAKLRVTDKKNGEL